MADWPAAADGQRYTGFVTTQSGVLGTTVTLPPVAQTKLVSFTTIIASTTIAASGIFVAIPTQTGAAARYFVDIAVGAAGFETIIIPNLYLTYPAATRAGQEVFFPITIPTGTRISARIQSTLGATAGLEINVRLMASGLSVTPSRSIVTTWGDTPATTNGTTIPASAAINTYGALVELKVTPYTTPSYSAAILATNPAGYWRMGEAQPGNVADASGNGHLMTATGTAMTSVAGLLSGDLDHAVGFPGKANDSIVATEYFTSPNTGTLLVNNTFSIVIWVNLTAVGFLNRIITQGLSGPSKGLDVTIDTTGHLALAADGTAFIAFSTGVVTAGTPHMIAVVKNGDASTTLYIDGVVTPNSSFVNQTLATPLGVSTSIGRNEVIGASAFGGIMDDVTLWGTALTGTQIASFYQTGLARLAGTPATNPYPVEEIIVNVQSPSVTSNNSRGVLSICIGPAGATEIAAIPISANSAVLTPGQNFLGPFPCHIPAGTNVWGKLRWSSLTAPVPSIEVTIYGVS